jgi:hypothetical protein
MQKNQTRDIKIFFTIDGNNVIEEECWHNRNKYINLGNNLLILGHFDLIIISVLLLSSLFVRIFISKGLIKIDILQMIPMISEVTSVRSLEAEVNLIN